MATHGTAFKLLLARSRVDAVDHVPDVALIVVAVIYLRRITSGNSKDHGMKAAFPPHFFGGPQRE